MMETHTFWAFFVIALFVGFVLGISYTGSITGKAIWDKLLGQEKQENTFQKQITSTSPYISDAIAVLSTTARPVTYQGVLDMLNKCTLYVKREAGPGDNCNNICSGMNKTCIQSFSFDENSEVTLPYECSWGGSTNGSITLNCYCCAPLLGTLTKITEEELYSLAFNFVAPGTPGGEVRNKAQLCGEMSCVDGYCELAMFEWCMSHM